MFVDGILADGDEAALELVDSEFPDEIDEACLADFWLFTTVKALVGIFGV